MCISTDNINVIWVSLEPGNDSHSLLQQTIRFFNLVDQLGLRLRVQLILGCRNILGDALSRPGKVAPTELKLQIRYQMHTFVSPVPDLQAWVVNVFSIHLEGLKAYAFLPSVLPYSFPGLISER